MIAKGTLQITGIGAVSPCGWSHLQLDPDACPKSSQEKIDLFGTSSALVRKVPKQSESIKHFDKGRFRKIAGITKFAIEAAVECLGKTKFSPKGTIIVMVSSGSIAYSENFFTPIARSATELPCPQYFPETVFNAACSHLCAYLEHPGPSYALLGDSTVAYEALCLARDLIHAGLTPECLIVAAEEISSLQVAGLARHVPLVTPENTRKGMLVSEGSCALRLSPFDRDKQAPTLLACSVESANTTLKLVRNLRKQISTLVQIQGHQELDFFAGFNGGVFDQLEMAALAPFASKVLNPARNLGEAFPSSALWRILLACRNTKPTLVTTVGLHQRSAAALVNSN